MSAVNSISSPDWQNRVYLLGSSALTDCSARGQVENGVCVCDGGWTGLSDFVNAVNVQCQVSIWSVRGLWVANLAAFVVVAVIVFPRILDLSQRAWNTRVRMLRKGKSYSVWSNSGLVSISFFFLVCFPSQMIVGMLRLFTEDRRIGMDYLITFFWFMERFGYYCAAGIHQPNLLRHLLKAQDASHTEVERFARLSQMLFGLAVLSGFWALPVLVTGGDNIPLARVCFAGYCFMQVTTFGLLAVQAHYLGIELHAVLTRSYLISRNEQTSQLRDMIMLGQKAARNLAAMQAIMYLAFFVAPPLWITHDYLLPISWFGPIAMSKRVVDSIYKHAKKSTGGCLPHALVSTANSYRRRAGRAQMTLPSKSPATRASSSSRLACRRGPSPTCPACLECRRAGW
jgi:hypothetical protein